MTISRTCSRWRLVTAGGVLLALFGLAPAASAQATDPETRSELLRREREEKATRLEPPDQPGLEHFLLDLESGRLYERFLNPAEGVYPKFGTITPGSGFSMGPAFRLPARLGGHVDFSGFATGSFKKYWMVEGRMRMPRLADERLTIDLHAQRYDFPEEDYFGIGPASSRDDHVTYGLRNTVAGGTAAFQPLGWLSLSGTGQYLTPRVAAYAESGSIGSLFDNQSAPGLARQPDYMRYEAMADVNFREPRGNPRSGGRYALTYQRFADLDGGAYSFDRLEADLQQYVPLLRDRRLLALRAFASVSEADDGAEVPFYLQRTLGGPDDLRGFRRFRFRDRHALLLQAEYRWEIFTAVDGAIFYDAGKVASRNEDLILRDLESDYGIGFRFGTRNGVFLRIEGAFGSREGKHFIFRFGNVF
jgi:hypothetical protein